MNNYGFRPAGASDLQLVIDLHRETLREYVAQVWGWDEEVQIKLITERFDPAKVQIIQKEEIDVGVLQLEKKPGEHYLANIQLKPAFHGSGMGTSIMNSLIRDADEKQVLFTLTVLKPNPVRSLYERLGFKVVKEDHARFYMERSPREKG